MGRDWNANTKSIISRGLQQTILELTFYFLFRLLWREHRIFFEVRHKFHFLSDINKVLMTLGYHSGEEGY